VTDTEYLRTSEVAKRLHITPKSVSRLARERKIAHIKTPGGHRRFPLAVVEEWERKMYVAERLSQSGEEGAA
jgi:excisionase family DNA binding protein